MAVGVEINMQMAAGGEASRAYIADNIAGLDLGSDAFRQNSTLHIRLKQSPALFLGEEDHIAIAISITLVRALAIGCARNRHAGRLC